MSEPTPTTVRGWLEAIFGVLNSVTQAATLAELQYLNRRLFGQDAAGGELPPSQRPALRDTLIVTELSEGGDPVRTPLADFLGERFKAPDLLSPIQYLSTLDTPISNVQAMLIDTDGGDTVADLLADAAVALSQIRAYVGPPGVAEGVSSLVEQALELLSQVRPLPAGQDIYTALASIGENTLRAAECCEEGQTGPTYPDPSEFACEGYPALALIGEVAFGQPNQAGVVTWVEQPTAVSMQTVPSGSGTILQTLLDGRQLCISVVAANEDSGGPYAVGGNFNPFNLPVQSSASRPSIVFSGGQQQTYGTFWAENADGTETIGYQLSVTVSASLVPQYPIRVYVYTGAAG